MGQFQLVGPMRRHWLGSLKKVTIMETKKKKKKERNYSRLKGNKRNMTTKCNMCSQLDAGGGDGE